MRCGRLTFGVDRLKRGPRHTNGRGGKRGEMVATIGAGWRSTPRSSLSLRANSQVSPQLADGSPSANVDLNVYANVLFWTSKDPSGRQMIISLNVPLWPREIDGRCSCRPKEWDK